MTRLAANLFIGLGTAAGILAYALVAWLSVYAATVKWFVVVVG